MRFKINEIGDEGLALDFAVTPEWLAAACPDLEARPGMAGLALRGRLSKSGEDFLLMGRISGALESTCSRCLEPARVTVDIPLAATFVSVDEDDEELEDEDVVPFVGGELDLSDEVRDEILLAIPLQTLCKESCRGLCMICGGNRNAVVCTCEDEQRQAASRFAALGKLKI